MEARRDVARAQAALRDAAAEAEAAAAAAQEAAQELEGALARIADIRDPEVLEDAAPEEHAGAAGRPPAHAATGEAAVGAPEPEPTGGASASRGEAAQETEEPAEEEAGGSEGAVAEELGEATVARRAQHAEVFARPRGHSSRYTPY